MYHLEYLYKCLTPPELEISQNTYRTEVSDNNLYRNVDNSS